MANSTKRKSILIILIALISGFIVLSTIFCSRSPRIKKHSKIVLITIDTLRADHLSCYGYPRKTSSFIDSLAERGVRFKNTYAQTATTAPSHASLFTSRYIRQLSTLKNGDILRESFTTLAELLKKEGFQTAGFVSTNTHFKDGNIDQGFKVFNEPQPPSGEKYRTADLTIDKTADWLRNNKTKNQLFLWVHLFDPHVPYIRHPRIEKSFELSREKRKKFKQFLINEHKLQPSFFNNNVDKLIRGIDLYDSEVFFADKQIERLYNFFQNNIEDPQNTLWIITADHGEGLSAHNWFGHGKHIYNEQIKVPLIFYSSKFKGGRTYNYLIELLDIFPTVLEDVAPDLSESTDYEGKSFLSVLRGKEFTSKKNYSYAQRRSYEKKPDTNKPLDKVNYEEGEKYSILNGEYKYILRTAGPDEFYNIGRDPYEQKNIIDSNPPVKSTLKETLLKRILEWKKEAPPQLGVNEKTKEKLRSLGYIQ